MNIYLPLLLVVLSNVFYHICSKSMPEGVNPFASLTVTYLVAAVTTAALFFATAKGESVASQLRQLNWTSFVLGLAIVGLEAGFVYMYKAGWSMGTGQVTASALLCVCLLVVGFILYREQITATKLAGVLVCLVGLFLLNK